MSTVEQEIPTPSRGLISTNTIRKSLLLDERDRRGEPDDLRERRAGYNPGFIIQMDPVHTGLQDWEVKAGIAVVFETGPVKRQNPDVDPNSRAPMDRTVDFLAGEGLNNVLFQHSSMGFRELLPLRGKSDEEMLRLFSLVHPTLPECVESGVIAPCIYGLHGTADEPGSCITCRWNYFIKLEGAGAVPGIAQPLFSVLKESVMVGRANMQAQWATWTAEVQSAQRGTNSEMALKALKEGHFFFMRQLHERTPEDRRLDEIAASAAAQAKGTQQALAEQSRILAAAMREGNQSNAENLALQERLRSMEETVARLTAATEATPGTDTPK